MDTAPPPLDIDPLVYKAAHLALWLAAELRALLAGAPGKVFELPFLRYVMRHYLTPAQAALRRAIHRMAAGIPPLRAPPRRFKPLPRAIPTLYPVRRDTPRAPQFRLTESSPRPRAEYIPADRRPRIRLLTPGLAPPPPPPPPVRRADLASYEARLRRRFTAFEAAIANPMREARRLLRLKARQTERKPLLSFAKIPGYRARPLQDIGRAAL